MNQLNRALIKSQARQLISSKIFALLIISLIPILLTSSLVGDVSTVVDNIEDTIEAFDRTDKSNGSNPDDYFGGLFGDGNDANGLPDDFFGYNSDNPIDSFEAPANQSKSNNAAAFSFAKIFNIGASRILSLIAAITSPLLVTLYGFYVSFIKRNPMEELKIGTELGGLFSKSFNETYLKKLVVYWLRSFLTGILFMLFIIPGIIFTYSSYFSFQIMNDYPNLKPSEAIRLSKKIVKGNRFELFKLNLSFFWWYLLCALTCGIAAIYVMPYVMTTDALYYENFRLRALADGRITEEDFLSAEEKTAKYTQQFESAAYQSYTNTGDYQTQSNGYYYQPQQSNVNEASQADYSYTQPEDNTAQSYYAPQPPAGSYPTEPPAGSYPTEPPADSFNDN